MPDDARPTRALSAREREVAALVATGKSNRAIAQALFLSERTVEQHVAAAFNKLDVRSRTQLALAVGGISQAAARARPPGREHNLPFALTSFVGRATEMAEISALLGRHRMVTVTGSGGVGKTRITLEVAASLLDGFDDGAWFVELAPLSSGDYLESTVAQAVGLALGTRANPLENLVRALRPKRALLIFDNCEHLLGPAARVADALLRACPNITLLASSRRRLGISGEETYRLPSLDVRPGDAQLPASDALGCAAIELFVERARTVDKRFELTDDNAAAVADICRRLDGIPLAIELAASRMGPLTPRQLRDRLDARFGLLTGGSAAALPRQRTLLATIDWSHDLLDERERALFRRLGIFVNGFELEGAGAVGIGPELDEPDVFEALSLLFDQSLVVAEPAGDRLRYRLLESTRLYACEQLARAGERDDVARRHVRYLADRFAQIMAGVARTSRVSELTDALSAELEDVRAALAGALARSDVVAGSELAANVGRGWSFIGLDAEERMWSEKFLAVLPADRHSIRARLLATLSSNLLENGQNVRAMELAEQGLAAARASGDPETLGWALKESAGAAIELGMLDVADDGLTEAETLRCLPTFLRMRLLRLRALLTEARGDHEGASRLFDLVIAEAKLRGDTVVEQRALRHVAVSQYRRGLIQNAVATAREILARLRAGGDTEELARWLRCLAVFLSAGDGLAEAAAAAREAIGLFALQGPESPSVAVAIEVLAYLLALDGESGRAAVLRGYSQLALSPQPRERDFLAQETGQRLVALLSERLAPLELERLLAQGAGFMAEAAVVFALENAYASRSSIDTL